MNSKIKSQFIAALSDSQIKWYPFTQKTVEKAKSEQRPLLVHIGYGTSFYSTEIQKSAFEDESISNIINSKFIPVLIDKDQHPLVHQYYQKMLFYELGDGGLPANIFLTPELDPIFLGTLLPKEQRDAYPGLEHICSSVLERIKNEPDEIKSNSKKITKKLASKMLPKDPINFDGHFPSPNSIMNALVEFQDTEFGGFGDQTKFPYLTFLEWAVEQILEGVLEQKHVEFIIKTIEQICMSPLSDQVRGGIHNLSRNKNWREVNYEKSLPEQGNFLRVLAKISLLHPSPVFLDTIILTLEYLEQEMFDEQSGFFTSQGSVSEGIEGLYFNFTEQEFEDALRDLEEIDVEEIKKWFGIKPLGTRQNQLNEIALNFEHIKDFLTPENWEKVRKVKKHLFQERSKRIPPKTDSKCISGWNFSILSALCDVIQFTNIDIIHKQASNLLNMSLQNIHSTFFSKKTETTRVLHHTNLKEFNSEYFVDYVMFLEAHSRLYEITGNQKFKKNVLNTFPIIIEKFYSDNTFLIAQKNSKSLIQNIEHSTFDQNLRSATSTFIALLRKWSIENPGLKKTTDLILDEFKQRVLSNPINHGEGIRALTYPDEAYCKITVPRSWYKSQDFLKMRTHFSTRFLLDNHEPDCWIVRSHEKMEATGKDFKEFEAFFKVKN